MKFHNSFLNMKMSPLVTPGTNSAHLGVVVQIYYANLFGFFFFLSKWDIVSKIVSMCSQ